MSSQRFPPDLKDDAVRQIIERGYKSRKSRPKILRPRFSAAATLTSRPRVMLRSPFLAQVTCGFTRMPRMCQPERSAPSAPFKWIGEKAHRKARLLGIRFSPEQRRYIFKERNIRC
jgi:hypothetical protein